MSGRSESVEIVSWDKQKLELKKPILEEFSKKISDDTPIAVLNVSGEFRTGKSTLLNLIMSVLNKYEECKNLNDIDVGDLKLNCGCLNEGRSDREGFGWKAGNTPCTKGIRILNKHFLIPNPCDRSKNMAVLLVDAEGLEANDSKNGSDEVLFGISNLMSSVLILNQKGIIGPSDMTNLRLLVEYCPPQKSKVDGIFCGIELLMRDFKYEGENMGERLNEMTLFKERIFNTKEKGLKNNLEMIESYYRYVDFNGLPHPGDDIEYDDFDGNMNDFSDEFKESVLYYIKGLLRDKLYPTYESKEVLNSLCETLDKFISKGIPQLSQIHKVFMNHENNKIVGVVIEKLIHPLKQCYNKSETEFYKMYEEVKNNIETDIKKSLLGTEEMVNESMEYLRGEMEMIRMEYEGTKSHNMALKLLEEEKSKNEKERQAIIEERKRAEAESERMLQMMEKMATELSNRPVQPIYIKTKTTSGGVLSNILKAVTSAVLFKKLF